MNEAHTSEHDIHPLCEFAQIFERDRRVVISWPAGRSSVGAWNGKWKKPVSCAPARHDIHRRRPFKNIFKKVKIVLQACGILGKTLQQN